MEILGEGKHCRAEVVVEDNRFTCVKTPIREKNNYYHTTRGSWQISGLRLSRVTFQKRKDKDVTFLYLYYRELG